MEKFTQKYCIVSFLKPLNNNTEFRYTEWPLHVTIVGVFACDKIDEVISEFESNVATQSSIITKVGEDAYFGTDKQVHVKLVSEHMALTALHYKVIKTLKDYGTVFNDPQYNEAGYKAHITIQSGATVKTGDDIKIEEFSLVDMFPDNDGYQRKIIHTFKFNK